MRIHAFVLLLVLLPTASRAEGSADAALAQLADDYIDSWYFPNYPTDATQLGVHAYDAQFEDLSRAALDQRAIALHGYEQRLLAVDPSRLSEHASANRELLLSEVRKRLLDLFDDVKLEEVRKAVEYLNLS